MKATNLLLILVVGLAGACDFNIVNPNTPASIGTDPSRAEVAAAATGLLIGSRADYADWILDAGILGREAYRFDPADPRFVTEFLQGPLDPGSGAFGGDHWAEEYADIRSANQLLNVIGTASKLTAQEQDAVRGFAQTIQAFDFLIVLDGHTEDSIPLDVNRAVTDPPAPFVTNDSAYKYVSALLDTAQNHLNLAGATAFPFDLGSGFTGFNSPATFIKFNQALKARVEVYRGSRGCGAPCYTAALAALGASFIDSTASFDLGVYHAYGTGPGDLANPLFQDPASAIQFAHPSIRDSAETKPGGGLDNRYTSKVVTRAPASAGTPALTSNLAFIRYSGPSASIPIIRNEELILLRAEANLGLSNPVAAATDINEVRVKSGGLAAIGSLAAQSTPSILGQILKQRYYSLLYEGGHRWIDMRRTGRINQIPIDRPGTDRAPAFPTLPIPTDEVLARQP